MPDLAASLGPITLRTPDGAFIPLRRADYAVTVDGPAVTTCATLLFHHASTEVVEADLVLPLPPFAVLQALHVRWGQRALDGSVRPRGEAREVYAAARSEGRAAVLGESEGEDLARVRLAPVEPGEDVQVIVTLLHDAVPTLEGHRVLVPLTYMARYVEASAATKEIEGAATTSSSPGGRRRAGRRRDDPARRANASGALRVARDAVLRGRRRGGADADRRRARPRPRRRRARPGRGGAPDGDGARGVGAPDRTGAAPRCGRP
ncbi:MAG: VIT domain-containing protein [Polyangiales bacterium]